MYFPLDSFLVLHDDDNGSSRAAITNDVDHDACSAPCFFRYKFLEYRKKRMMWKTMNDSPPSSSSYSLEDDYQNLRRSNNNNNNNIEGSSYKINVTLRFKPSCQNSIRNDSVTLPLHQRLALIRLEHKLDSNRDALNILKEEGEWFKEKWLNNNMTVNDQFSDGRSLYHDDSTNCIQQQEDRQGATNSVMHHHQPLCYGVREIDCQNSNVVLVDPTKGLRNFQFDCVLPVDCSQNEVYAKCAKYLVCDLINGTNASCLVYGVTGSGKTYTMFGPPHKGPECEDELRGIIPRACKDLFHVLNYRRKHLSMTFESSVAVSYIEVFGNTISDLLRKGRGASYFSNKTASSHGFVLGGAAEVNVNDYEDIIRELKNGEKQKRRAATALNEHSTRAHSIFIISLNQTCITTGINRVSKLFLVDLGGSEQAKKSNIAAGSSQHIDLLKKEYQMSQGNGDGDKLSLRNHNQEGNTAFSTGFVKSDRMREAVHINLGLMSLKKCVTALVSGDTNYIPYADSKLTMMLSTALGGNCRTSVIICASKSNVHFAETVASLKFGLSCRSVTNTIEAENEFLTKLLKSLDSEISKCEEEIKKKERWEVREEQRIDPLAQSNSLEMEGFGGIETRKTTVLVGAEKERKRLEHLIRKKSELTGTPLNHNFGGHSYGGSIGFGVAFKYGLGKKKDDHPDDNNSRFQQVLSESDIPDAVKKSGGKQGWKQHISQENDSSNDEEVRRIKVMKKKSTLAYSGISA